MIGFLFTATGHAVKNNYTLQIPVITQANFVANPDACLHRHDGRSSGEQVNTSIVIVNCQSPSLLPAPPSFQTIQ
jgi:hypothetical protein